MAPRDSLLTEVDNFQWQRLSRENEGYLSLGADQN